MRDPADVIVETRITRVAVENSAEDPPFQHIREERRR
jgi:hypothetical protein